MTSPPKQSPWQHWYEIITSAELRQGDIFRDLLAYRLPQDLPVMRVDPAEGADVAVRVKFVRNDWIVLSASCDVVRGADTHVLLARVVEVNAANLKVNTRKELQEKVEVLRQGYDPWRFLLAECDGADPPFGMSFVEYRQQVFLPLQYLKANCTGPRLRLCSPVREKLGAWAAANLGRVGLEDSSQIPKQGNFSASAVLRTIDDPPYP